MKTSQADILILPGLGGGGPDHWYSRWQSKLKTAHRVEQKDWDAPVARKWASTVSEAISMCQKPVVLIAHSMGVLTAVHAAHHYNVDAVVGAYLVAPPDVENAKELLPDVTSFAPIPVSPLPFPSVLVASDNDPYCSLTRAEDFSYAWGSKFESAGSSGHINDESGQGPWPEGLLSFANFMSRL